MRQPRILFCVHDGRGLGHLTRLGRVAAALQEDCACLFLSGHRQAAQIVPDRCEFVHLPSLDSLFSKRAAYWGRRPFLEVDRAEALRLRKALTGAVFREFGPDAVVIDHLPLGHHAELAEALAASRARKYLMLRGVLSLPERTLQTVFAAENLAAIESSFERILVASDLAVCDFAGEYRDLLPPAVLAKVAPLGYVAPRFTAGQLAAIRRERGLGPGVPWVVCSAGGGMKGEDLIDRCALLCARFAAAFDLVYGPRSHGREGGLSSGGRGDVRVWRECWSLPLFHAAADVVICRPGYNTLMETATGNARLICVPLPEDPEQSLHAERLARHLPLTVAPGLDALADLLAAALDRWHAGEPPARGPALDLEGAENARRTLLSDLGLMPTVD